ncbi:ABC transporter ATP-binding protein [Paraburkholderia metrosideri]|uniref:Galactose/methyl galactoside import ATP-binding protein MglA n=1 Tax=Paraburkholderia metrosideri TaxID=580937 RepID=A0ABM8NDT7_9BURK|nr:ABC transporter ATP-binding protein [Paraburkholderia metrosideri]CAD6518898.1 Galactose/methyl galactoside import ATP-binding protein MglA [Paraburkholderia metrosideri]
MDATPVSAPAAAVPVGEAATPRASVLRMDGIGKRFGQFQALTDVSLELCAGEVHCLLGENGAGKSTLCNVMFGVHQPDAGAMWLDGAPYRPHSPRDALTHGIAMVHQHFSLVEDVSVLDNLLLGQARGWLDRKREAQRVRVLVAELGLALDPDARVADLSVGEKQRVEIVKCLIREPRLLVLDEPTAVLLPAEIDALLNTCAKVVERGCAVVLVTHKLAEIRRIANRATVLQSGRVVARSSNPSADVDALVRAMIQRPAQANDAQPADNTVRAVAPAATPSASPYGRPLADEALQVDGLTVRDADGVMRLQDCTLVVNRGEIVGIAGVEGNGQSELGAVLAGMQKASAGRFFVQGKDCTHAAPQTLTRAGVGVVPEDRHAVGCVPDMSVTDNLFLNRLDDYARRGFMRRRAMRRDARTLMQRFDVRAASPDVAFRGLSGGNQQKAVLARELTLDGLAVLVAAQPTRGLDVGAVAAVYEHIRAARDDGVGVLLISSELDELMAVADRVLVMYRGRIMGTCVPDKSQLTLQRERIGAWMAGQTA